MRKILTLLLISVASVSFAKQLENYQEIENAVKAGNTIVVVTDFNKCKPPVPLSGQFAPSAVILTSNSIVFSDNHFTTSNPQAKGKPANEYTIYRLKRDNSVDINKQVVILPEYNIQPSVSDSCLLSQAVKFYTTKE